MYVLLRLSPFEVILRRLRSGKKIQNLEANFFPTNKQQVKIKLMQNETNLWSIFLVKTKYW